MRKVICYFCFLLFLVTACEYPITENYIDIPQPDKEIAVSMDLNAITNGKAILINKSTALQFSLSLAGKKVTKIKFTLGDKTWEDITSNGTLRIDESEFPSGQYTLKAEFYAPTGSGSIADQLGAEAYAGEMNWPVIIDYTMELPKIVNYRINENKSLELSWQAPIVSHLSLESYTIEAQGKNWYTDNISGNQSYYIDTRQVGYATVYTVRANFRYENKEKISWELGTVSVPDNLPRFYVAKWDLENVYLAWDLPYHCSLSFTIDKEAPFSPSSEQKSLIIPVTKFGSHTWWDQKTVTMLLSPTNHPEEVAYRKELYAGSPGYYYENERSNDWSYNPSTQLLHAMGADNLNVYQYPNTTSVASISTGSFVSLSNSPTSPIIALVHTDKIEIRDARTLEVKHSFAIPESNLRLYTAQLTTDDKIIYRVNNSDGITTQFYISQLDGTLLSKFSIKGQIKEIASDGKRIFYQDYFETKVIELDNYQCAHEYTLPIPYALQGKVTFNPLNSSELIIFSSEAHTIETRQYADYKLTKTIHLDNNMSLLEADPVTGNLLVQNDKELLKVLTPDGDEILHVNASNSIWPKLKGNYLISYDGYLFDIQKPYSK